MANYRSGPDLREIPDESPVPCCEVCGAWLEWEDCDQCGGEGGFDWEELQFEDPLWYQPGDYECCAQCDGRGGWWWCWNVRDPAHVVRALEREAET